MVTVDSLVHFEWNELSSADYYVLSFSDDSSFFNNQENTCFGSDTSMYFDVGRKYWQIGCVNLIDTIWSEIRSFDIINLSSMGQLSLWLKADSLVDLNNQNVSK